MGGLSAMNIPRCQGTSWYASMPKRDQFHFNAAESNFTRISDMVVTAVNFLRQQIVVRTLAYHANAAAGEIRAGNIFDPRTSAEQTAENHLVEAIAALSICDRRRGFQSS